MTYNRYGRRSGKTGRIVRGTLVAAFALAAGIGVGFVINSFATVGWGEDVEGARNALLDQGLTPIEVGGYSPYSCGEDDFYATKFVAKNANGRVVRGTVCAGYYKGSTIRFDR